MPSTGTDEPRRLTHCHACGYALDGLADEGACPECGAAYDQSAHILYGFGRGRHSNLATATWPRALLHSAGILTFFLFLLPGLFDLHRLTPRDYVMYGMILLAVLVPLLQRLNASRPGLVQIWITPKGCGQKDDLSPDSMLSTVARWLPILLWLGLLPIVVLLWPEGLFVFIVMTVVVVVSILVRYGAERQLPWTATPAHAPPPLRPWKDVQKLSVIDESESRYRIRVTAVGTWWERPLDPVDAEVTCTDEHAQRLIAEAKQWLHASRQSPGARTADPDHSRPSSHLQH